MELIGLALLHPDYYQISIYWKQWTMAATIAILIGNLIFWTGIITVYMTSVQLEIKWRVIGILCGWIPIIHLITLGKIIHITSNEIHIEKNKIKLNESRQRDEICKTKYPILLVHGVFFRDFQYINYWGRIPNELQKNGATIYYGNQQSADSVENCGKELADRIKEIILETNCQKVNIIAHSKGGLDSRAAISTWGMDKYVVSLTTINTPHRGCEFADYLLSKAPESLKMSVAKTYNTALKKIGDPNPNFIEAVTDLTASACKKRNESMTNSPNVYYQSVGSKLNTPSGGRFPLNMTHSFVKYFDGANDGLVGENSFPWGEHYQFLTVKGKRGISHGDMVDLNRENFDDFDVREFYVQLVADLKKKGL
ncbi:Hydrolase of alpha/beta superfamily, possible membrane associated lipase [Lachnospiraceae bacterium TWA4]|nr:Hydrolase of alpha/beta superfamily, possible membrane associated lipase [Lachnospiraceae bacterium TWA4]